MHGRQKTLSHLGVWYTCQPELLLFLNLLNNPLWSVFSFIGKLLFWWYLLKFQRQCSLVYKSTITKLTHHSTPHTCQKSYFLIFHWIVHFHNIMQVTILLYLNMDIKNLWCVEKTTTTTWVINFSKSTMKDGRIISKDAIPSSTINLPQARKDMLGRDWWMSFPQLSYCLGAKTYLMKAKQMKDLKMNSTFSHSEKHGNSPFKRLASQVLQNNECKLANFWFYQH